MHRLLPTNPDRQLVFDEKPAPATTPQVTDTAASRAVATAVQTTGPAPPLKRIRRPATSPTASPRKASASSPASAQAPPGGSSKSQVAEDAVVRLTNRARTLVGCTPLRVDARLSIAARRHSADMAERNYFSHISPSGTTFVDRAKATGYSTPGAENIARGYRTHTDVMAGWMKSSGHRANILNCDLRSIGVGVHYGPDGPWWTQAFGWR